MENPKNVRSTHFVASLRTEISIQLGEAGERFKSVLVGMQHEEYLILRLPNPLTLGPKLSEGMDLILRYFHFGSVYGCIVSVRGWILKPLPLLFLSFPRQVQSMELRKVKRVEVMIPATAMVLQWKQEGMIRDISSGGVMFCSKAPPAGEVPGFRIDETIILSFPLLGREGHHEFLGKVRRVFRTQEELSLGVQFEDLPPDISNLIESYIEKVMDYGIT